MAILRGDDGYFYNVPDEELNGTELSPEEVEAIRKEERGITAESAAEPSSRENSPPE